MASLNNILSVGSTGTLQIDTLEFADSVGAAAKDAIGSLASPIVIAGGNVAISTTGGNVYVSSTSAATVASSVITTNGNVNYATDAGLLTVASAISSPNGTVTLNGAAGVVLNAVVGSATTGAITITGPLTGAANIVTGTGNVTLSQGTDSAYTGIISGTQGLFKTGVGTLTLSTNNGYSGATSIANGGSILTSFASLSGGGTLTVGMNGTFSGSGSNSVAVIVSGTIAPGAVIGGTGILSTGNLSFSGSTGILIVDINGSTAGTGFDKINVNGAVDITNGTLQIYAASGLTVGSSYAIITGTSTPTGSFSNGSVIHPINNPAASFTVSIVGNDVLLTCTNNGASALLDVVGSQAIYYAAGGSNNALTVATGSGMFTIADGATPITLTPAAVTAGWTIISGTVSGSTLGISNLLFNLGDGTDDIVALNAGSANITLTGSGTVGNSGTITTTGNLIYEFQTTASLGTINVGGDLTASGISSLILSGTVTANGTSNLSSTTISATASGKLVTDTAILTANSGLGTSIASLYTQATSITAVSNLGGVYITEDDGADFTVTAASDISLANLSGTLNLAGATTTTDGNISLSSQDSITLDANLIAGSGTITIAANTDGIGTQGFDQKGAILTTANTSTNALSITVNTVGGGTGDAIIGQASIGSASGGTANINSHGGSILWSADTRYGSTLTIDQIGFGTGGSNTQTLRARLYNLNSTNAGGIGTDARPIQIDNFGPDSVAATIPTPVATAGTGGVYVTGWDQNGNDLTLGNISAQGAGNIRVVGGSAGGHNMWIRGNISTGSGYIYLATDDNFDIGPGVTIGGAGFSGNVWLQANRDPASAGQPLTMSATSAIITSSTVNQITTSRNQSTQAVYLDIHGAQGSPSLITLGNITTGDGGLLYVNAIPSGIAAEAGSISMAGRAIP